MFHVKHPAIVLFILFLFNFSFHAQTPNRVDKFAQLGTELPTPNQYRTASGAPGVDYWQQKVDYIMDVEIDENAQTLTGSETITYHNQSPDPLEYLWLQLDQNVREPHSDRYAVQTSSLNDNQAIKSLDQMIPSFQGGHHITRVEDSNGNPLEYTINKTMMRIDLPFVLKSGESFSFEIDWWYLINNRMEVGGRSGYEYFEEDENSLYTIAQFFPRLCVYDNDEGWQNKQFLGRGEFALEFGDYKVNITVPEDHLVASTGTLQNEKSVLNANQRKRLQQARSSFIHPVIIHTEDEARVAEKMKKNGTKTWTFHAKNVRDFAFASSRKFIWDAMAVKQSDGSVVMAMSMYPKEGNPLWEQYSTKAVAHTLKWYSHYTFDYPYPVAWSIHAQRIGMEYPMICFNFGRPEADGTYDKRTKYGMIGVIIHEVGHNYFPMIVNSDERQWTWMDEGLNSFVQYLAQCQWERNFPHRRGPAYQITDYMKGDKSFIAPIMTNSESIFQFGNNAYGKPATALNILRETVIGRDLFDKAFKTYSNRWKFKHPTPADFFRTMEDASGVDLDWFWRGWFYTTDHVDQAITSVVEKTPESQNSQAARRDDLVQAKNNENRYISNIRNQETIDKTYDEIDTTLVDFYTTYDPIAEITSDDAKSGSSVVDTANSVYPFYYEIEISNVGELIMPVILQFVYEDGSDEVFRIPAEIWRFNFESITKVFPSKKKVSEIILDPFLETADVDTRNNYYPERPAAPSRFEVFKQKLRNDQPNPMQRAKEARP